MSAEIGTILEIINEAALAYKGVIPADCWKEPYMTVQELTSDLDRGLEFYGWEEKGVVLAVMGIQPVGDVTLIRHAYVRKSSQRQELGKKLLRHLLDLAGNKREVLVGTWTAASWAIKFYQENGFTLIPTESRKKLKQYWSIPERQAETSVVLRLASN